MDKIYHPLKTDDPVDMYKVPICKMIDKIAGDEDIFKELIGQALNSGNYEKEEEAKNDLLNKLLEIDYQKRITSKDALNHYYFKS